MECPRCQYVNADGARFCGGCGASLTRDVTCASCGHANRAGQKFCNGCGGRLGESPHPAAHDRRDYTPKHLAEKILTARAALEGERKQVTVLFADVKGSMELAEQLDPEEWHEIMDRFFHILTEGVHRFEGTVNQYTGDGIMALFGAPIAHEDHAQRACYAALHLRDELRRFAQELRRERGFDFATRIGLNSGEVVVGKIGDDLRMDYTAQGHTVGLAQRMEALAEAGRIYLTAATAERVEGFFALEDLGAFNVKGASAPVHASALEGVGPLRTRLDVSQRRGFSRFVGRMDEMARLDAALERSVRERGEVVGIVADAGTGKSRLCFEFAERCRARGIPVREARCVSHGRLIPYVPVLELLRGYFGIDARDGEREARRKIAGTLLLLDRELEAALPLLFDFLGVPDPERPSPPRDAGTDRQLLGVFRRLIEAESRRQPGVLLIEDLHWIDAESDVVLAQIVEAALANRGLLLLNFRPEYRAAWMERLGYQHISLLPLGSEAIDALLAHLLGSDPTVAGLAAAIRARTAGNPFFVEEVVREQAESGVLTGERGSYRLARPVTELEIPASVQGVLAGRIDRLEARDKGVLQTASVIGKEFSERALSEVAGLPEADLRRSLEGLVRAELLYERELYPEAVYAFSHPLTQEVAYRSQLQEHRRRVHAAITQHLSQGEPEKLDERAALLAYHCEGAGDRLEAARWLQRARVSALARGPQGQLQFDRKLLDLLHGTPESEEVIDLTIDAILSLVVAEAVGGEALADRAALFARAQALAARAGHPWLRAAPLAVSAFAIMRSKDFTASAAWAQYQAAADLIRQSPDVPPLPNIVLNVIVGRFQEARAEGALLRANWNRYDYRTHLPGLSMTVLRYYHAQALIETGAFAEGREVLDELARGSFEYTVDEERFRLLLAELTGEIAGTLERGQRAMAVVEGVPGELASIAVVAALEALAAAHLLNRSWAGCAEAVREAVAISDRTLAGTWIALPMLAHLAEAELGLGNSAAAHHAADEAVARLRQHELRWRESRALLARIRVLLATEGATAAERIQRDLDDALALCERNGTPAWQPLLREEQARLHTLRGEPDRAAQEQRTALELYTKLGATGHVARLRGGLAS